MSNVQTEEVTVTGAETKIGVPPESFVTSDNGLRAVWKPKDYPDTDVKIAPLTIVGQRGLTKENSLPEEAVTRTVVEETSKIAAELENKGIVTYVSPEFSYIDGQPPKVADLNTRDIALHALKQGLTDSGNVFPEQMPDTYVDMQTAKKYQQEGKTRSQAMEGEAETAKRTISIIRKDVPKVKGEGEKEINDPNAKFIVIDERHEVRMKRVPAPIQPKGATEPVMVERPYGTKVIQIRYETMAEVTKDKQKIKAQGTFAGGKK